MRLESAPYNSPRRAGATVIAAVRTGVDDATAQDAGAHHVVHIGLDLVQQVHALAPQGVSHIVDVAFGANIAADVDMLDVSARSPPTPPT